MKTLWRALRPTQILFTKLFRKPVDTSSNGRQETPGSPLDFPAAFLGKGRPDFDEAISDQHWIWTRSNKTSGFGYGTQSSPFNAVDPTKIRERIRRPGPFEVTIPGYDRVMKKYEGISSILYRTVGGST